MRRYISHLFTWVISFLTLLAFSSCLNEHPKDQLDGGGSNGSASEIFDTTIAPLYDFMGGTIDGEGIRDIQCLDSLLSLSPDDRLDHEDVNIWRKARNTMDRKDAA